MSHQTIYYCRWTSHIWAGLQATGTEPSNSPACLLNYQRKRKQIGGSCSSKGHKKEEKIMRKVLCQHMVKCQHNFLFLVLWNLLPNVFFPSHILLPPPGWNKAAITPTSTPQNSKKGPEQFSANIYPVNPGSLDICNIKIRICMIFLFATITNYHKLGGLNNANFLSYS